MKKSEKHDEMKYIKILNNIGIALSAEKEHKKLLEKIVASAMKLTNADGGSLYLLDKEKKCLIFEVFLNTSLNMKSENNNTIQPVQLYNPDDTENLKYITSYCVLKNQTQNIPDVYEDKSFDFSGPRDADKRLGYRSKSFLTIPMKNHEDQIIGVLQLINAMDENGKSISFSKECQHLAESLASQASIAITQKALIQAQKDLFEALIALVAKAIDEKSIYTSNHCTRIPILTSMIAEAANETTNGPLKDFHLTKDEMEELRVAAWLHDCGKISIPEHVMDKATKLEGIFDRLEVINLRLEVIKRDMKLSLLEKHLKGNSHELAAINEEYEKLLKPIEEEQLFLNKINLGAESLSKEDAARIKHLASNYHYHETHTGNECPLLSEAEASNLSIYRGTLNDKERDTIQNHVKVTQKMLGSLPYPDYLKRVPEIAGNHHERIDGRGYPNGLTGAQILPQAKIVAIADIFEALTAADRPYKPAKTLTETLKIMEGMKANGHIDPDLFTLFVDKKLYLQYAKKYLNAKQIDRT